MAGHITFSWGDYSREPSSTTIHTATVDDTNIDAISTAAVTLGTAFDNVSLCTLQKRQLTAWSVVVARTYPTDKAAQRELKWLVSFRDDVTGLPGSFTIPGAMTSLLTGPTDEIDLTAGGWPGFVTAVEANVKSNTGNAVTVTSVKLQGRRN